MLSGMSRQALRETHTSGMLCILQCACLLQVQAHHCEKLLCCADHHFTEAVDGYTRAIELNPNNAVYYANRAAAHIHLENFGCALTDASRAIEIDPKYTKVRMHWLPIVQHLNCMRPTCISTYDAMLFEYQTFTRTCMAACLILRMPQETIAPSYIGAPGLMIIPDTHACYFTVHVLEG